MTLKIKFRVLILTIIGILSFKHCNATNVLADNPVETKCTRVISIDSGGIRDIIPLYVLTALEHLTGKPVHQLADILVGSGTGGVDAVLFSHNNKAFNKDGHILSAAQVLKMRVCDFNAFYQKPIQSYGSSVPIIGSYVSSPVSEFYDVENFRTIYSSLVGEDLFAPQNFTVRTLVTGHKLGTQEGLIVDTHKTIQVLDNPWIDWSSRPISDVLLMSSILPGFVQPQNLNASGAEIKMVADGTIPFPNPAYEAASLLLHEDSACNLSIVSLGTGLNLDAKLDGKHDILQASSATHSQVADTHMKKMVQTTAPNKVTYTRLQPAKAGTPLNSFDDCSPENIEKLLSIGFDLIQTAEFKALCTQYGVTTVWSAEEANQAIRKQIKTIDFKDLRPFTLRRTIEDYLQLEMTKLEQFLTDRQCFAVLDSKDPAHFILACDWADEMAIVIQDHSGDRRFDKRWLSSLKNMTIGGRHEGLLNQLEGFKLNIQQAYSKLRQKDAALDVQYFALMKRINVLDRSSRAKEKIIRGVVKNINEEDQEEIQRNKSWSSRVKSTPPAQKYLNLIKETVWLEKSQMTEDYIQQLKDWANWLKAEIGDPSLKKNQQGQDIVRIRAEERLLTQIGLILTVTSEPRVTKK